MSQTATQTPEQPPAGDDGFSRDATLSMLSNQRRRFTIHFLKQQPHDRATLSDLSKRVASWENDKPSEGLSHSERKRVRNALRQFHLPKMVEEGFVEYDTDTGVVRLTARAADVDFYVDSLTGGDVPWGVYYLVFSALSTVCLVGFWFGVAPFDVLPPIAYVVCFVTALFVSSLGHMYDTRYRMRLGARAEPPEVGE